ncbi:MAG: hypothetical protein D6776_07785 [Planctomycetota bacterium]|nr:MAG: hypothetical protein D6776_07785 [Planctomycetota bacterium]
MGLFGLPTLGDIVESVCDSVMPEVVGDIVGGLTDLATGNVLGVIDSAIDLGQNVVSAGGALVNGIMNTGANTIGSFLNGPGCSRPPFMTMPPIGGGFCGCGGYAQGGMWPPQTTLPFMGNVNDPYVQGYMSGYNDGAGGFGGVGGLGGFGGVPPRPFGGLNFFGMTLEEKIAAIMARLMERAERKLEQKTNQLAQAAEGKSGGFMNNLLGTKPVSENVALQELQQAQNKVNQLNTMWTNITQAQQQAHMAVARNLRG